MIPFPLRRVVLGLGLAVGLAGPAAATRFEFQAGDSIMDGHGTPAAFVETVFAAHRLGGTRLGWAPDLSAGWLAGRDLARYRGRPYDTNHDVALLAAGVRFRHADADGRYGPLFFSFQLAANDHTTEALSSHYQFVSTLGWQAGHWSIQLRHVSNGGLNGPNRGETMALIGFGFDP